MPINHVFIWNSEPYYKSDPTNHGWKNVFLVLLQYASVLVISLWILLFIGRFCTIGSDLVLNAGKNGILIASIVSIVLPTGS